MPSTYFVYVPGKGIPKKIHETLASAIIEAQRLSNLTGKNTEVFSCIKTLSPHVDFEKLTREELERTYGVFIMWEPYCHRYIVWVDDKHTPNRRKESLFTDALSWARCFARSITRDNHEIKRSF